MITGELKNKVDSIWDTIWTGGITSPVTVLEQITYLMFMKLLDENQLKAEANANVLGVPLKNKVFRDGVCVISEEPRVATDYRNLRWNVFHNFEPGEMLTNIQTYVFPFIKAIGEGKDTAFSRYMKDTVFLIPTAKVLAIVEVKKTSVDPVKAGIRLISMPSVRNGSMVISLSCITQTDTAPKSLTGSIRTGM